MLAVWRQTAKVVVIKPISKLDLFRSFPKLCKGSHIDHPRYEHHRMWSVTVAARGIVLDADGERCPVSLTVQCAPGALTVLA